MLPGIYRQNDTLDKVLKRYISLQGDQFNFLHEYAAHFSDLLDLDRCDTYILPYLAELVGIEVFPSLTSDQLRKFLRDAIYIWSHKGTIEGIEAHCHSLTGWPTTIIEESKSLTVTNRNRTFDSANPTSPFTLYTFYGPDANEARKLRIELTVGTEPVAFKTALLDTTLPARIPVGVSWYYVYL